MESAVDCDAKALVTTEKDMVKLAEFHTHLPLYALRMVVSADKEFDQLIRDYLKSA